MRAAEAAGIVLAGGRSSRMGRPKAALDWAGTTLLAHVVAVLAGTVGGPVVVVAAPGQELPAVDVEIVTDPVEGLGPLQGIGAGLAAVAGRAPVAFVAAVDLPLLHPAFVHRVLDAVTPGVDVALPVARGHHQPLAAAYRTGLAELVAELITAGRHRPGMLYERCTVARLDESALLADPALAAADPDLASLTNVNTPEEYAAVLRAGSARAGNRTDP